MRVGNQDGARRASTGRFRRGPDQSEGGRSGRRPARVRWAAIGGLVAAATWQGAASAASFGAADAAPSQDVGAERYVRARSGAKVYNYQDYRGNVITELPAESLLRVLEEHTYSTPNGDRAWLEVSAPGGFPVWVFGKYLEETGTPGVLRSTAPGVRMRPIPDNSVAAFPLRSMLEAGDRVEFLERADSTRPFAEDWIKVWAPKARGFVALETVDPEPDVAAARAEWQRKARVLPDVPRAAQAPGTSPAGTVPAGAPKGEAPVPSAATAHQDGAHVPDEAFRSYNYGNTLLANALKKGSTAIEADFDEAIRAYRVVLDMVPEDSSIAGQARDRLEKAEAHQTIAAARGEIAKAEERRLEWLEELKQEREDRTLAETVHWGRFMGRGWVEAVEQANETHYFLRWSGELTFEIACQSGRYDLGVYEGYEIGVMGSILRERILPTETTVAQEAMIDVSRIEVISGSPKR